MKPIILLTCACLMVAGCSSSGISRDEAVRIAPVPSLLGTALSPVELDPETRAAYERNLAAAQREYDADPLNEMNIIWLGRRLAYLGRYLDAVAVFSQGLESYPNSHRLLRHRGHRYITLRKFDLAIADLQRAATLIEGMPDAVEPDGQPNAQNIPRSTTNSNIYYHLGLALYCNGQTEASVDAWRTGLEFAKVNDDMFCATLYWLYHARRRAGQEAGIRPWLRAQVREDMDVIENHTYHRLLLHYAGIIEESAVIDVDTATEIELATAGYGIANERRANGRADEADQLLRRIIATDFWPAFGYIAAEADLARGS